MTTFYVLIIYPTLVNQVNVIWGENLSISTTLRNGNSYFQVIEKYSVILRQLSFIHPTVLKDFSAELEGLVNKIDTLIIEVENADSKTEKMFELRRLTYQLEDLVNFKMIQRYNQILDGVKVVPQQERQATVSVNVDKEQQAVVMKVDDSVKNPKEVWESVSGYLKQHLNVHTFNVWVKPIEYHSCEENKIKIMVQNQFYKNWLEDHCSRLIKKHLDDIKSEFEVTFVTN